MLDARGELAGIANVGNPGEPYAQISCAGDHASALRDSGWPLGLAPRMGPRAAAELMPLATEGIRVDGGCPTSPAQDAARCCCARARRVRGRSGREPHAHRPRGADVPAPAWPDGRRRSARSSVERGSSRHRGAIPGGVARSLGLRRRAVRAGARQLEGERRGATANDSTRRCGSLRLRAMRLWGSHSVGRRLPTTRRAATSRPRASHPPWRKRGVALALLRHTFAEFRSPRLRRGRARHGLREPDRARFGSTSVPGCGLCGSPCPTRRSSAKGRISRRVRLTA